MLTELLLQFFDDQPRRETSIFSLLAGKKTISTLYAALLHHQLTWLQLYPTLGRADFQAALATLTAHGQIRPAAKGLVLTDPAAQAAAKSAVPLPRHFRPTYDVHHFAPRFYLAVQVISEALAGNRRYRPVSNDWATQQAVHRWYRTVAAAPQTVVTQLTAAFAALPPAAADLLAQRLVGHDYVGTPAQPGLVAAMAEVDALSALIAAIAEHPQWTTLQALWGGPKALLSPSNYQALTLLQQGQTPAQITRRLHLRPSTVNEHILGGAILGAKIPVATLYSPALQAAFAAVRDPAYHDYQRLLAQVPGSDFFQVRLFQILTFQGRWPR